MDTSQEVGSAKAVPYDPYAAHLPLRWIRRPPSALLFFLLAPIVAAILITGAAISGALGSIHDFQPTQDIQRAWGKNDLLITDQFTYPLIRDTPTLIIAIVMVVEFGLIRWQWQQLAEAIPRLARNGVIRPATRSIKDPLENSLRLRWLTRFPPEERFSEYVSKLNKANSKHARWYSLSFIVLALALAAAVAWIIQSNLFQVLIPDGATPTEHEEWRRQAYENWWASTHHPAGMVAHFMLAFLAFYIIIAQSHVGLQAIRISIALPRLVEVEADWTNPDGDYGWGPVRKVFDTVWTSMVFYGVLVTLLVTALGLGGAGWIPAGVWLVFMVAYFVIPRSPLRKIEEIAKERHIATVRAESTITTTKDLDELRQRIKRYRTARIWPMSLSLFKRITALVPLSLPLLLNLVQLVQVLLRK